MSRKVHSRVALVTAEPPYLSADDARLANALGRRGVAVTVGAWDDAAIRWTDFDGTIVRAATASLQEPAAFAAWLARVEESGSVVMNPPAVLVPGVRIVHVRSVERRIDDVWSLVFLGGEYSHAMLGRRRREPPPWLVADARNALGVAAEVAGLSTDEILMARIDGFEHNGRFALELLDCIEPVLYLFRARGTADRLAELVERRVRAVARM
jgi:hypothetical protein